MTNCNIFQRMVGMAGLSLLLGGCGGLVGDSDTDNNKSGIQQNYPAAKPAVVDNFDVTKFFDFTVSVSTPFPRDQTAIGLGTFAAENHGCIVEKMGDKCPTLEEFQGLKDYYLGLGMSKDCFELEPGMDRYEKAGQKVPEYFTDQPAKDEFGKAYDDPLAFECYLPQGYRQVFDPPLDGHEFDKELIRCGDDWRTNGSCLKQCQQDGKDRYKRDGHLYVTQTLCFPVNTVRLDWWKNVNASGNCTDASSYPTTEDNPTNPQNAHEGCSTAYIPLQGDEGQVVPLIRFVAQVGNVSADLAGVDVLYFVFKGCKNSGYWQADPTTGFETIKTIGHVVNNTAASNDGAKPFSWYGNDTSGWVVASEEIAAADFANAEGCPTTLIGVESLDGTISKDLEKPIEVYIPIP